MIDRGELLDHLTTLAVWLVSLTVVGVFGLIVGDVVWSGFRHLSLEFLVESPHDAGRAGGILPVIVSTLGVVGVCLAVTIPLGLGGAVFLAEFTRRSSFTGRLIRRSLDVLAGVPSIVFGLFGNAFFCTTLGLGFSIASGGLTLACMVLPLVVRSAEESLRSLPRDFRRGAAALGMSRTTTLRSVLIPAAMPGLVVGLVLGIGRALAETAALLFTSGYVDRLPTSLLDSGRTLSVHIYDLAMNVAGGAPNAHASALVLLGMLAALFALIIIVTNHWKLRW